MNNLSTIGQCMGSLQQNILALTSRMSVVVAEITKQSESMSLLMSELNEQRETASELSQRVEKLEAYIQEMEQSLAVTANTITTTPLPEPSIFPEVDDIEFVSKKKKSVTKKVTIAGA